MSRSSSSPDVYRRRLMLSIVVVGRYPQTSRSSIVVHLLDAHLHQRHPSAFDFVVAWNLPFWSPTVASRRRRSISTDFVGHRRPVLGMYRQNNVAAPSRGRTTDTVPSTLWRHLPNVASSSSSWADANVVQSSTIAVAAVTDVLVAHRVDLPASESSSRFDNQSNWLILRIVF